MVKLLNSEYMINKLKKFKIEWIIIIFFTIFFLIGILTFKNYGISGDEKIERNHSLVIHYYLRNITSKNHNNNGLPVFDLSSNLEKLVNKTKIERNFKKYQYKYYGVALQMPLTFVEQIFNYKLDISIIYYMRHLFNFLVFFISTIYFYKLVNKFVIKNKLYSLFSTIFLVLSPCII